MLEALIDKVEFEIIVVKKKPAKWSTFEQNWFIIKDLDDSNTEAKVSDVLIYPYRVWNEDGTVVKKAVKPEALQNDVIYQTDLVEI